MSTALRAVPIANAPSPSAALERAADLPYVILLESAARDDPVHGRYSYLAASPEEVLVSHGHHVARWVRKAGSLGRNERDGYSLVELIDGLPLEILRERLRMRERAPIEGLPPFQGGAAGLFSYELARTLERLPAPERNEFDVPELAVGLYDAVVAWDHRENTCHVIERKVPRADSGSYEGRWFRMWEERLAGSPRTPEERATAPLTESDLGPSFRVEIDHTLRSNFSRAAYVEAVARVIEYIRAGDAFQVNIAQRLLAPQTTSALDLYRRLREHNPAAFAGYFDLGEHTVASSSPELFLALRGDEVTTRPIKGTRPRGATREEDASLEAELAQSEKDRAENVMIVDLLRNDLSRVSRPHSVTVPRLFDIERHPTVWHLVSEVHGTLRRDRSAIDLLEATFPGGSITGAPKIRAMEIITELEKTARGPYCGSLAWIDDGGDLGASILIRTATVSRGWIQLPVGGGITAQSDPEDEYQETLDKAAGMLRALRG